MYCSIQEAWGSNFGNDNQSRGNYQIENFENPNYPKPKRKKKRSINYQNSEEITIPFTKRELRDLQKQREDRIRRLNKTKISQRNNTKYLYNNFNEIPDDNPNDISMKKNYNFSRGMNRLPQHNGPTNRQPINYIEIENDIPGPVQNNNMQEDLSTINFDLDQQQNMYQNQINNNIAQENNYERNNEFRVNNNVNNEIINNQLPKNYSQEMYDSENNEINEQSYNNSVNLEKYENMVSNTDDRKENQYQDDNDSNHNLSFLIDKIGILIDKMDHQGESNNLSDIFLFILTGIFIIFVLDSVFRIGKFVNQKV